MQATITYLLTEEAQRAQMAATGQPVARKQTRMIEVAPEDMHFFRVTDDGKLYLDYSPVHTLGKIGTSFSEYSRYLDHTKELHAAGCPTAWDEEGGRSNWQLPLIPDLNADVLSLIKRGRDILAAKVAEERKRLEKESALCAANSEHNRQQTEVAYQAFLADPAARLGSYETPQVPDLRSPADFWPQHHNQFMAEIKRRNREDEQAKKAAEAAKEQAKSDYIAEWVSTHAPEEIREQFTDGLLCRTAALEMIANHAFEGAGVPEAAAYDDAFCSVTDCPCGRRELKCLPRSVYPAWRAIKAGLPEGYAVEFLRVRECKRREIERYGPAWDGTESAGPPIYLAEITIPHGPFRFDRTVKLR